MTEAIAQVIDIPEIQNIPNADNIGIIQVGGYQVVIRKQDFAEQKRGLFISVDSMLPDDFLDTYNLRDVISKNRVKTKRLRGIYSQGLVVPIKWKKDVLESAPVGTNMAEQLEIKKFEPKLPPFMNSGIPLPWPTSALSVYDIESLQNPIYRDVFGPDDVVYVTEKIHGANANFAFIDGEFHVTSRRVNLKRPEMVARATPAKNRNPYWFVAEKYRLEDVTRKLSEMNSRDIVIRAEIYGKGMQFLHYGLEEPDLLVFDLEIGLGKYQTDSHLREVMNFYMIPVVPTLHSGKFDMTKIEQLAEQESTVCPGQMQEGVVIRDADPNKKHIKTGRKILKMIGKRYTMKAAEQEEYIG